MTYSDMVIQYINTLQIVIKYKYLIIKLSAQKTKIIEAYCHQMYHIIVYKTSNQVCHNCILIIHAFSRVCTIVLQLLHNLLINPNVCFLITASKLYIYHVLHTYHWHYNAMVSQEFVDMHY